MAQKDPEKKHCVTILWRIENFNQWGNCSNGITSSWFNINSLDEKRMFLLLYPISESANGTDVHLALGTCSEVLKYPIDCEWSFLGSNQLPLHSTTVRDQTVQRYTRDSLPSCPSQAQVFVVKKCFLQNGTLTVRCCIQKSMDEHAPIEKVSLLSEIEVRKTSFPWTIRGLNSLDRGDSVPAPLDEQFTGTTDKIRLNFFCDTLHRCLYAGFKLFVPRFQNVSLVKLHVYISNSYDLVDAEHAFGPFQTFWRVEIPVSIGTLEEYMDPISHSIDLSCTCVYKYYTNSITDHNFERLNLNKVAKTKYSSIEGRCQALEENNAPAEVSKEISNCLNNLKEDFLVLYQEHSLSDFELCSNDVSFPVHKCVLSARSPVFRAMFCSDMEESCSKSLDVPDLDTHTLNRFLIFLYTGTVEQLQWKEAAKLYYAADKYDVSALKQICRSTLQCSLEMSNVCDVLVLADRHQDQELTSNVHDFILGDFDEVMHSEEWESFMEKNPMLALKTTHQLCKKKHPLSKKQHG